jgi:anthranilate phosphoribosyltransferase
VLKEALARVVEGGHLSRAETSQVFAEILSGSAPGTLVAGLLIALRMRGETADEIAGAAQALRERAIRVQAPPGRPVLDTCGTGGDGANTFNVSTAAALVAAGAGATVAKHGNRSVSSRCGSADVLAAAGVKVDGGPEVAARCLAELGIGFLFAPALHAGMAHVAPIRRELGVRSLFNILGPLANPAGATRQLLGVFHPALVSVLAQTLRLLGSERALVAHGEDGLDEVSPSTTTRAALLAEGEIREVQLRPEDVGLTPVPKGSLAGGDAAHNARLLRDLLGGERGPIRDAVLLNTAAALWAGGLAPDLRGGYERAADALDSGAAARKLEGLVRITGEGGPPA